MKINTAAVYARVSRDGKGGKPGTRRQDTENQLHELREYCGKQGWTIVHEYIDRVSGKRSDNRREFQAMMQDASQRRFDVVVVWALDRFTREGVMQTFEHIKTLRGYGVEFESFTEAHFRTTGPAGELMIAIAAWIAKQERERIVERTLAGLARARREGKTLGRPRKIVNRDKALQLQEQGLGMRAIGKKLGVSAMKISRVMADTR
jgi:DNA invertase Pin-like site-specific DNA recombinase